MDNLKTLQSGAGFSRKSFAEKMKVEVGTVKRWEDGAIFPSKNSLRKIKTVPSCSYDAIIDGSANQTPGEGEVRLILDQFLSIIREFQKVMEAHANLCLRSGEAGDVLAILEDLADSEMNWYVVATMS